MARAHTIRVGRSDVAASKPSHTPGVREGNADGRYATQAGHHADGTSGARRSTGVNAAAAEPIDPRSPNLSPA
jgi:hypothetical protein